jgi:hypothetical protein
MPELSKDRRRRGFEEVALGFDAEGGQAEARRCLNCGYCCECFQCVEACQPKAVTRETHAQNSEIIEIPVVSVMQDPARCLGRTTNNPASVSAHLKCFYGAGHGDASAPAERGQAEGFLSFFHGMNQGDHDAGAGGSHRMTQPDP